MIENKNCEIDKIVSAFPELSKEDKVKNILAFLVILFGESNEVFREVMKRSPDYIIEKFARYVLSSRKEFDWGLHPSIRCYFFNR